MAQPLFVGTVEELLERSNEFSGLRVQVFATEDEAVFPEPPLTIRDKAHLEELLLAGVQSPKETLQPEEWEELRREVRERLKAAEWTK